jgi:hypothetical protein
VYLGSQGALNRRARSGAVELMAALPSIPDGGRCRRPASPSTPQPATARPRRLRVRVAAVQPGSWLSRRARQNRRGCERRLGERRHRQRRGPADFGTGSSCAPRL